MKHEEFKKELKELLQKYNAEIYADVGGKDLRSLYVDICIDIDYVLVTKACNSITYEDL